MEQTTRRHFLYHNRLPSSVSTQEIAACHFCQIRSFATHEKLPITIVNETKDGATIPHGFRFIDSSVLGKGVELAAPNFRSGCECASDEDCMYSTCHCLGEMDSEDEDDDPDDGDDSAPPKKKFSYHSQGRKKAMLRSNILDNSREAIYECHDGCNCGPDCPNRVVERGRQVPLEIFRTKKRGWGVRAMAEIKRGQFVDRYLGEIITAEEANRRRADSDIAKRKDVYLFALDKFSNPNSLDPRLAGDPLEVDGEFMSGPTRFINHSCEPNMRIFARVGDHADKHIHDLALFATRDIHKGEELTFDYVDGIEGMESDAKDTKKQGDMTPCLCGTRNCRRYLW